MGTPGSMKILDSFFDECFIFYKGNFLCITCSSLHIEQAATEVLQLTQLFFSIWATINASLATKGEMFTGCQNAMLGDCLLVNGKWVVCTI